jgi:Predicted nucleic acid-binding protein, contains PIN domain
VNFLLDTSIVSELVKKNPYLPVLKWLGRQDEASLYLSVITIGELEKGIAKLPASARRSRLRSWIQRDLAVRFGARMLSVDLRIAARWGVLTGEAEKHGKPLSVIDSLIAATALVHGLAVVTRNVKDFERSGATVINPWKKKWIRVRSKPQIHSHGFHGRLKSALRS